METPPYLTNAVKVYTGKRIDVVTTFQKGRSGSPRLREVVIHPGSVLIVPELADGRIVLIQNYRIAVNEPLWELPAGTLESGEPPIECARRELLEETGYRCGSIEPLLDFYTFPGIGNERMYAFLAKDLTLDTQRLEDGEDITVTPLPWDEILRMIFNGTIHDAKTIAGLLYLQALLHQ